jgi:hypothetical protein
MKLGIPIIILFLGTESAITAFSPAYYCATLAYSGTSTTILSPGGQRSASYAAHDYNRGVAGTPASWVWDETGGTGDCYMDIRFAHSFTLKCLNVPLTLYASADDEYTFYLNGASGSGNSWEVTNTFSISTSGISCGIFYYLSRANDDFIYKCFKCWKIDLFRQPSRTHVCCCEFGLQ